MDKEQYRKEYLRLFYPDDLITIRETYKIVTDAAFTIIGSQKGKTFCLAEDVDALYLFQMTILKNLSILKLSEPSIYENSFNGDSLNGVFDPFSISSLVRNQYESFCNFNNIYIQSSSPEEKVFKYNMWVLSGLKNRQRFPSKIKENALKKENERSQINELMAKIKGSSIFLNSSPESQVNVESAIKKKNWQIVLNDGTIQQVGWHQLFINAGINDLLEGQYSALSLYSHPSNVSVFQFKDYFSNRNDLSITGMQIKFSTWITSLLVSDYCFYFPDAKEAFNRLPKIAQILVNGYNLVFRNESFKINNASEILND